MFLDGLEDAYDKGRLMGRSPRIAPKPISSPGRSRTLYALNSLERANRAITNGDFAWEIAPVSVKAGKSETLVATDEQPPKGEADKIPTLKPPSVTAAR